MFCDFILATPDDLNKLAKSNNPAQEFNGFGVKSLTDWDMAIFYSLASGNPAISDLAFEIESVHHSRGMDIRKIPDKLLELVSGIDDNAADVIAADWEKNEDSFCYWDKDEYFNFIKDFRSLLVKASSTKKSIYMILAGA